MRVVGRIRDSCLICKPETKLRVNLHNCQEFSHPSSVYIRLYFKQRKNVFYCFYKITSSKDYNARKDQKIHFTDQNVSCSNINLTIA